MDVVKDWFGANDFIPTESDCWETAWSHSSGYGFITLRFYPLGGSLWWAIVETGPGAPEDRDAVNLGEVESLKEMAELYGVLKRMEYDNRVGKRLRETGRCYPAPLPNISAASAPSDVSS